MRKHRQKDKGATAPNAGPKVQGEGDYEAARRYRDELERFVRSADIERAAREARPRDEREAEDLAEAEAEGKSHARPPSPKGKEGA
jgi:hypothetical protein